MSNVTTFHEFGFLTGIHLPLAYGLYLQGKLTSTTSRIGTSPLFYFSPSHSEIDKTAWSSGLKSDQEYYSFEGPKFNKNNWVPPPLKDYYKNTKFVYDKPLVTINNKKTVEWGKTIFNYFDNNILDTLFTLLTPYYKVVYICPPSKNTDTYIHDPGVPIIDIGDIEFIKTKYPEVTHINDYLTPDTSYNEIQMMLLANSDLHITCAGGDAQIVAYFGGEIIMYIAHNSPYNALNRPIWRTNSWLRNFSGANITSHSNYNSIIGHIKSNDSWRV